MIEVPIKRGTTRRLGLVVPLQPLTVHIAPDLSALKQASIRLSLVDWTEVNRRLVDALPPSRRAGGSQ